MNCTNIRRCLVSFFTLWARSTLRALWPLRTSLPLRSRHTLDTLCSLRTGGPLRAWIALWPWISTASSERQCYPDGEYR
jgi:hypothetical protein